MRVAHCEEPARVPGWGFGQRLRWQCQDVVDAREVRVLVAHGREVQLPAFATGVEHSAEATEDVRVGLGGLGPRLLLWHGPSALLLRPEPVLLGDGGHTRAWSLALDVQLRQAPLPGRRRAGPSPGGLGRRGRIGVGEEEHLQDNKADGNGVIERVHAAKVPRLQRRHRRGAAAASVTVVAPSTAQPRADLLGSRDCELREVPRAPGQRSQVVPAEREGVHAVQAQGCVYGRPQYGFPVQPASLDHLAALLHDEPYVSNHLGNRVSLLRIQCVFLGSEHVRELLHGAAAHDAADQVGARLRWLVAVAKEATQHHRQGCRRVATVKEHRASHLAGLPLRRGGIQDALR
mmetsp:Transcript_77758/g.214908  ORF Transcript_77758/g.214908 Transcript_77758/m.214908 type:complete len:347 (+) Transcript_77758:697-1737(+)